ncbi:MAG: hypothetical protein SFX18_09795 [Pirellulales bacterium]|nr:hypothetical protein [Pirellulales bacterium]
MSVRNRLRNGRQLKFEQCESRIALAGDVAIALEGTLLNVTGDNLGNEINITQSDAGNVTIRGLNGTTVNGLPAVTLLNPGLEKLDIRMGDGNDRVTVGRVSLEGDLNVDLGTGNDFVAVGARVANNVSIIGDAGSDQANVNNAIIRGDLVVDLGQDAGRVVLNNTSVGFNATIITDAGNDVITSNGLIVGGNLSVESKAGNDSVTLINGSAFALGITTDLGDDRVSLSNYSSTEDLNIETGDNNDRVTLTSVTSSKSININTDSGNDTIIATNVRAALDAVLAGGAGFDAFDDNGFFGTTKTEVKEIESFI